MRQRNTVIVTGAAGVLGSAVVDAGLGDGGQILAVDRRRGQPREGVEWVELDLTRPDSVDAWAKDLDFSSIRGVIHCAGGFRFSFLSDLQNSDIDFLVDLNFKSSFYLARSLARGFKVDGYGRLVFIGAQATQDPGAGMGIYAASKTGVNALVRSMQAELRSLDVSVNAILPSVIDTPTNRKDMPEARFEDWVPPQQVAALCEKLMGPLSCEIRGALIPMVGRVA